MNDGEPASAGEVFLPLVYGAWFHVEHFPDVAIEVLKSVSIHETMVLWLIVGCTAGGDRLAHHVIDVCSALSGQSHKHFCTFRGVANRLRSKSLELVVS